jgi:hypothetical protein
MTLFSKKYLYLTSIIPQLIFVGILFVFASLWGVWGVVWTRIAYSVLLVIIGIANMIVLFKSHDEGEV